MTAAIELKGTGKRYWQLEERAMLLKSIVPFLRPKKTERWALRGVDIEVERGETVGILGRNGAGKTTLLRLLAGVSRPSEGTIAIRGRVAPLIGVGVGFHQEMSGRENIFVNGMLLGLTKRQVAARFDEVVSFAELEDYIDTPVKFYSTGMFLRLGFSVAAHVDPDILLVDEILAVGDLAFQVKCIDRMRELQRDGTTILMVSHSMHAIRGLCPRAVLIRKGMVEIDGPSDLAIARHHELMTGDGGDRLDGPSISIIDRNLLGPDGPTHHAQPGDRAVFRTSLQFHQLVETPQINFQVVNESGVVAYELTSALGQNRRAYGPGETAVVEVPFEVRLARGTYRLSLTIGDRNLREVLAHDGQGFLLYVAGRIGASGVADLAGAITIDGAGATDFDATPIGTSRPSHSVPASDSSLENLEDQTTYPASDKS